MLKLPNDKRLFRMTHLPNTPHVTRFAMGLAINDLWCGVAETAGSSIQVVVVLKVPRTRRHH